MFRATRRKSEPAYSVPVQEFGTVAGRWQPHPANVRAVSSTRAQSRLERGDLYVVIETPGHESLAPAFHDQLISTIAEAYYAQAGSITRGLREAIQAGNMLLYQNNMSADENDRVLAGINCAVVRGEDVYIGQLGPSLSLVIRSGNLTRFPEQSIWFQNQEPSPFDLNRQVLAGLRKDARPELALTNLDDGDLLVLANTSLARGRTMEELAASVAQAESHSVQQWATAVAGASSVTGIVVGWTGQPSSSSPEPVPVQSLPALQPDEEEDKEPAPQPASRLFDVGRLARQMAPDRESAGSTVSEPETQERHIESASDQEYDAPFDDGDDNHDDWEDTWQSLDQEISPDTASTPPRPRVDLGELRDALSDKATQVRQNTESILAGVMPDKIPERPVISQDRDRSISLSGRALVAVALALPLVMLFFVMMTRIQYDRTQEEQFSSILALAQARYDSGMRAEDPTLKRQELNAALDKVNEGLALQPEDERLLALERTILHRLDGVDTVTRIPHFWRLHTLSEDALLPTESARIVIQDRDIYLLNRGSDRVYKFLLNDVGDALQTANAETLLVARGDAMGGIQVGDLVDIAWLAKDGSGNRTLDTFVTLERAGSLLAYDAQQGIDVLPVADSVAWLQPQAIGGYFGNLYVLDPLLGHILKYEPTDNAYTTSPIFYVDPQLNVDLTGAIDMTIDGNVYVLFANGTVKKFFNGQPTSFGMIGLPSPLENPVTIFVSGEQDPDAHGYVYIADAGNERILQFDKVGNYVRQYRSNPGENHMNRLQGLYVDEQNERMFLLNDNTLWLTNLESAAQ